jgi:hypothetical protein
VLLIEPKGTVNTGDAGGELTAPERYVFLQTSAGDTPALAGIRYGSRLGDNLANWPIFEPNEPRVLERAAEIDPDDPDLRATLKAYDLVLQGE